ncbi:hypothetical protein [Azospirillum sp.]|uniref:hypothetical protein n=1 Tax=Azospirillum sp. TaxID=34012 RepID=UPI002D6551B1|nr:hypothetical protein [Azospirillum sp.]HYF90099.1 hypothetical protein [Azospirillum sp.]
MSRVSFLTDTNSAPVFITDGTPLLSVRLFAVTAVTQSASYQLSPLGSSLARALVDTHSDRISLSGLLVGESRQADKLKLETMAESAMRGSLAGFLTMGLLDGLIVTTPLAIRTNMFIESLNFTVSAAKIGVIDVSITFQHVPRPATAPLSKVLDIVNCAVPLKGAIESMP